MTVLLHKNEQRGRVNMGWLDTQHSFSFGSWYDPRYMGVSVLRVINEDRIAAHRGFGKHGHNNMEILTYVLSGSLTHQDSMGNIGHIHAGEWQLMSAGTGVQHSEMNSSDAPVHLLQIWLLPNVENAEPTYQQIELDPKNQPNQWHMVVSPRQDTPLLIRQNAQVSVTWLQQGQALEMQPQYATQYAHVIAGRARIETAEGCQVVETGDALVFSGQATLLADQDCHVLWFDLPQTA